MDLIEKAIIFATKAHENQTRKGTNIPYITHPYAVGMYLQKAKCSEEVIAAGILHDTLEDTKTSLKDLTETFGHQVANLVKAVFENDKSLPWEVRKQHTIEKLQNASLGEIQITVADKLHNLKSICTDIDRHGESVWERFNGGKREQHWYYASIVKVLSPRKKEFKMIRELEREVKEVFGSVEFLSDKEIALLFSCAYLHIDNDLMKKLKYKQLAPFAEKLIKEADTIYRNQYDLITSKLKDLHSRGVSLESSSEGPFILASFCIALQNKMHWSNQELFEHFKKNLSNL